MNRRIAFVHYPHSINSARLETMPFALNSVLSLANAGWEVDLFLGERRNPNYKDILPDSVRVRHLLDIHINRGPVNFFRRLNFLANTFWRSRYHCVLGVGQMGAYIASLISRSSHCPFIYLNDEYPSQWVKSLWGNLEKNAMERVSMVVVPGEERFEPLCHELGIDPATPHASLPNIPVIDRSPSKVDWHKEMGIPENSRVFLHAGSMADWALVPEIIASLPAWPEEAVLVLHGRHQEESERFRKQFSPTALSGKIFWSTNPLKEADLHSLISSADGTFGLYRNLGPNIEHMGFSSGKIMRSIACGTPVIASDYASLTFIKDHNLGILVDHPSKIPGAVRNIMENLPRFRENCARYYQTEVSFEPSWSQMSVYFQELTGINLADPER
jgi:glycosyltransferase involved in cell wall biosynthesis